MVIAVDCVQNLFLHQDHDVVVTQLGCPDFLREPKVATTLDSIHPEVQYRGEGQTVSWRHCVEPVGTMAEGACELDQNYVETFRIDSRNSKEAPYSWAVFTPVERRDGRGPCGAKKKQQQRHPHGSQRCRRYAMEGDGEGDPPFYFSTVLPVE